MPALSLFSLNAAISLPADRPAARRRGGLVVVGIVTGIAVMGVAVIGVLIDDGAGDGIEDERTRIRLALEIEHVIERICIAVD